MERAVGGRVPFYCYRREVHDVMIKAGLMRKAPKLEEKERASAQPVGLRLW